MAGANSTVVTWSFFQIFLLRRLNHKINAHSDSLKLFKSSHLPSISRLPLANVIFEKNRTTFYGMTWINFET